MKIQSNFPPEEFSQMLTTTSKTIMKLIGIIIPEKFLKNQKIFRKFKSNMNNQKMLWTFVQSKKNSFRIPEGNENDIISSAQEIVDNFA